LGATVHHRDVRHRRLDDRVQFARRLHAMNQLPKCGKSQQELRLRRAIRTENLKLRRWMIAMSILALVSLGIVYYMATT